MRGVHFDVYALKELLTRLLVADLQTPAPAMAVSGGNVASAILGACSLQLRDRTMLRVLNYAAHVRISELPPASAAALMVHMFGGKPGNVFVPNTKYSEALVDLIAQDLVRSLQPLALRLGCCTGRAGRLYNIR
jgi:hypothetical protein